MGRTLRVEITGDSRSLERALNRSVGAAQTFGGRMQALGGDMTRIGSRMALGITAPLALIGRSSFKAADEFETSQSRIVGLAGQSQKQVDAWGKQLLKMAPQLGRGPRELSEALYFVASSGVPAGKALSVVTASAKAATAGLGSTVQVADAVTSAMNAYAKQGLTAAEATDVLVATVREGKGEASEFAPVIGNVAAFASKLGVSFDDVGAALAGMTQLGTDASTASTQLQAVFSQLLKPTDKAKEAAKGIGLSYDDLLKTLRTKGLMPMLDKLRKAFKGNEDQMGKVVPNVRALRAVLALAAEDGGKVAGVFARMDDSTGDLADAFQAAQERTGFTMEKMRASLEVAMISLGSLLAPTIAKIAEWLAKLSIAFSGLSPQWQKIIAIAGATAAAIGPVLIVVGSLIGAIGALAPVVLALASPVGLIVIGIAALTAALVAAVLWPDKLKAGLQRLGLSAKDAESIVGALRDAFRAIHAVVQTVWPSIQQIITGALNIIRGVANVVLGLLQGDWSRVWKGLKLIVSGALGEMIGLVTAMPRLLIAAMKALATAGLNAFKENIGKLPGALVTVLTKLPGVILGFYGMLLSAAVQLGGAVVQGIKDGIAAGWEGLKSWVGDKINALKDRLKFWGSGPDDWAREEIGVKVIDGIIQGLRARDFKPAVREKISEFTRTAAAAIQADTQIVVDAMDALASAALAGFDKLTSQYVTKSERQLERMEAARAKAQREAALAEAQAGLAEARAALGAAGGPEGESESERAARLERAAEDVKRAEQALGDAQYEIRRAQLEAQAEQERAAYENRRELKRRHLEEELTATNAAYERGAISAERYNNRVLKILEKYGVPMRGAARALGLALAEGLTDAFANVQQAARALANEIERQLSKLRVVVNVNIVGEPAERRQHGGPVAAGVPYIVGERGAELFVPGVSGRIVPAGMSVAAGRAGARPIGGGGGDFTVNVAGSVVTERELSEIIRRELLRYGRRNASVLSAPGVTV